MSAALKSGHQVDACSHQVQYLRVPIILPIVQLPILVSVNRLYDLKIHWAGVSMAGPIISSPSLSNGTLAYTTVSTGFVN